MSLEVLLDPLFRVPFVVGLIVALVLPLLGVLLRLRDEWLAALGFAHLAGASGLIGLAAGVPVVFGGIIGAVLGAGIKSFGRHRGNTVFALMLLIGWAVTLLVAANTTLGDAVGHALIDGQLYFAGRVHLYGSLAFLVLSALLLPWIAPRLVRARLFPGHEAANQLPAWRWHLSFDVMVALAMALGTGTVGLMGAFALVFIPPWIGFRFASHWHACLRLSVLAGVAGYLAAFIIALMLDQPFGPVLVMVLVVMAALTTFASSAKARLC